MLTKYSRLSFVVVLMFAKNGLTQTQEGERCIDTHTNTYGVCRPARSCESAILDYKQNSIRPTFCSYNYEQALVCCRDGSNILQAAPSRRPADEEKPVWGNSQNNQPISNLGASISERKCEEYSRAVTKKVEFFPLLPNPETMSVSVSGSKCNFNSVQLIIGGQRAELGEFPHMAAIGWADFYGGYSFRCGGSLISRRFVLTAGHCTWDPNAKDPKPVIVRLGDRNLEPGFDDGARPVDVPIRNIIKHPKYNPPSRYNDIALLELATDVDLEVNIRPACLWQGGRFTQDKAVATGWGVTDPNSQTMSNELQKVSITLLDNNYCDRLLNRNRNWRGFADTQLCAGELAGGKDTCQGDSGAPLQLVSRNNSCIHHIIGITSFGHKCAERGKPAVYTRVSSYLDWIESVVWRNE